MKVIFLIQPRQSGKTTKAMYEFIKDPDNTLFVTRNRLMSKEICDMVGGNMKNFTDSHFFNSRVIGINFKNIILDEYMFFLNKDEIYKTIQAIKPDNVYIFSTSNKKYNKDLLNFVKENKSTHSYQGLILKYGAGLGLSEEIEKQIYELYYNFLTDEDTVLIDYNFSINPLPFKKDKKELIEYLGKEKYEIEILNSYLV
jgi:hypothetical protein